MRRSISDYASRSLALRRTARRRLRLEQLEARWLLDGTGALVSVLDVPGEQGNTIEVPVQISLGVEQIQAIDLVLAYDPADLAVLEVEKGPAASGLAWAVNTAEAGRIRVGLAGASPLGAGGTLLTLHLHIDGALAEPAVIEIQSVALNESAAAVEVDHGTVFDNVPPAVTVAPQLANVRTPSVTGAVSDGVLQVSVNGKTYQAGPALVIDGSTWTLQIPEPDQLDDGVYDVMAAATDAAGNTGQDATSGELTIDATAPAAPVITGISTDTGVDGDGVTSDATLIISGTAEAGSSVQVLLGGSAIGTETTDGDGNWSFDYTATTLAAGDYNFTATATDKAGNTSGTSPRFAVTIDTTAPAAPVIIGISTDTGVDGDGITSDPTVVISGTAEAGSAVQVLLGGSAIGTATTDGDGNWSFDYTATALAAGDYSFTATATDTAGNASATATAFAVTIDTTAPAAPVITGISTDTGVDGDGVTSDATLVISGTAEAGSTVQVLLGGNAIGSATADDDWSFDYTTTTLAVGDYTFTATATDTAGNTSGTSTAFAVIIDTTAPAAPVITGISTDTGVDGDGVTSDPTLIIHGTAEAGSTVQVRLGGSVIGTATTDGDGNWIFDYTATTLAEGDYMFTATATDTAGNLSGFSPDFPVTVNLPPVIQFVNRLSEISESTDLSGRVNVAEIGYLDGGWGVHQWMLAGDDAALFETDGQTVYLKPDAALDFETNPDLNLSLAVDDPDVGSSPDQTLFLSIQVTDANEAPFLATAPVDQTGMGGIQFLYVLPGDCFDDVDQGDQLSLTASLSDGSPLPDWLNFDPDQARFSGTPGWDADGTFDVKVMAHDSGTPSLMAAATFRLAVALNTAPWQNPHDPYDVDNKDGAQPLDVLTVINYINAHGSGRLPLPTAEFAPPNYFDINGDNEATPYDVLQLINHINASTAGNRGGEGEAMPALLDVSVEPMHFVVGESICEDGPSSPNGVPSPGPMVAASVSTSNDLRWQTTGVQRATTGPSCDLRSGRVDPDSVETTWLDILAEDVHGEWLQQSLVD